jgi:hypothetical protein
VSLADLLEVLLADTEWQSDAACRPGPGRDLHPLFMPLEDGRAGSRKAADARFAEALVVCASCTVRPQCAAWAAEQNIRFGVWGGVLLGKGMFSNRNTANWKPLRRVS